MVSIDKSLPNGLGIGPMRTGSSWLHEYLASRGDVCLPKGVKETFYFAEKNGMGEAWYENHFHHYDPVRHLRIIEICPTLFDNYAAIGRVSRTLHEPTLMVTLRNPVDRTWSHYMHWRQHGRTTQDFDTAVRESPEIVTHGLYARHLNRWLDEFGRGAVRITLYDDLKERPVEYARQVDEVFGLPASSARGVPGRKINSAALPVNPLIAKMTSRTVTKLRNSGLHWIVNAGKRIGLADVIYGSSRKAATRPVMNPGTHDYLVEQFSDDVDRLEKLLHIDLGVWRRQWAAFRDKPVRKQA